MIQSLRGFVRIMPRGNPVNIQRSSKTSLGFLVVAILPRKHAQFGEALGGVLVIWSEGLFGKCGRFLQGSISFPGAASV